MFGYFKKLFGGHSEKLTEAIKNEAILIDVRSQAEFQTGSIENAINIPLDKLKHQSEKLNKNKTIIVFCASGMRSAHAKSILEKKGFSNIINGGSQKNLQSKY